MPTIPPFHHKPSMPEVCVLILLLVGGILSSRSFFFFFLPKKGYTCWFGSAPSQYALWEVVAQQKDHGLRLH